MSYATGCEYCSSPNHYEFDRPHREEKIAQREKQLEKQAERRRLSQRSPWGFVASPISPPYSPPPWRFTA